AATVGFVLLCISAYRVRLRQVTRQLSLRFEERVAERTRIAQELHDTLLQGLVGASMQLHVVKSRVPANLPARRELEDVCDEVRHLVDESRDAVSGLRPGGNDDLAEALARIPDLQSLPASSEFRVIVEGQRRPLNGLVRDEVYRIGREAVLN